MPVQHKYKMKVLNSYLMLIFTCILVIVMHPVYAQYPGCNGHGSEFPQITGTGNDLSVTWSYEKPCGGGYAYMTTSLDSGTTFGNKIDLSKNNTIPFSSGTRVILGNDVYYAWMNYTFPNPDKIFLAKSTDGGITFDTPSLVTSRDTHPNEIVALDKMIVSGNNVFVIWSTNREIGNENIGTTYLSKSTDGGITFENPVPVNKPDTNWYGLETVTSGNMTYLLWQSVVNGTCILGSCDSQVHVRSIDNNGNLGESHDPFVLSKALQVKIAASGNDVYITGVLFRPNLPSNETGMQDYEPKTSPQWIFFSKSTDDGNTFSSGIDLDMQKQASIPEFSFAVPVLLIGVVSVIGFYRMKFRK